MYSVLPWHYGMTGLRCRPRLPRSTVGRGVGVLEVVSVMQAAALDVNMATYAAIVELICHASAAHRNRSRSTDVGQRKDYVWVQLDGTTRDRQAAAICKAGVGVCK